MKTQPAPGPLWPEPGDLWPLTGDHQLQPPPAWLERRVENPAARFAQPGRPRRGHQATSSWCDEQIPAALRGSGRPR